jgi:hypothetical protein
MLQLDLMRLESPKRFQDLCLRLARRFFVDAQPLAFSSHDGGRDIIHLSGFDGMKFTHDMVWQVKFTEDLGGTTRRAIKDSIRSIQKRDDLKIEKWVLCLPVDPTGVFHEWLTKELATTGWKWEIWGKTRILEMLETHVDVLQSFFYPIYEELRQLFVVEELALVRVALDPTCEWAQPDDHVLVFSSKNVESPDLVFDIIVQNKGQLDAVLLKVAAFIFDRQINPHGIPGSGLLFSQITYEVSIKGGTHGEHRTACEPPLVVRAGSVERFKVKVTDTGYAWYGAMQILLEYSGDRVLPLPAMRLYT